MMWAGGAVSLSLKARVSLWVMSDVVELFIGALNGRAHCEITVNASNCFNHTIELLYPFDKHCAT